jgi:hypothetical protein
MLPESSPHSAAEVDAVLATLREPGKLTHAQELVTHTLPKLSSHERI